MKIKVFLGVLCLFGLLFGAAQGGRAAEAVLPVEPEAALASPVLSGRLSLVWGDGQPGGPAAPLEPLVFLADEQGQVQRLELLPGATMELLALNQQQVRVELEEAGAQPGSDLAGVRRVRSLRRDPAIPARSLPITGPQPWVSILCKFSDEVAEPKPLAFFQGMYANAYPGVDHFWRQLSYEKVTLQGSGAYGWYTLPHPRSYYVYDQNGDSVPDLNHQRAADDCSAAADAAVYFPDYVGINLMFNANLDCCAWGGGAAVFVDGQQRWFRMTWEPPWGYANVSVIAHENGHGFGLPHSSGMYGQTYDNDWDVMSNAWLCGLNDPTYGCVGQHTIAAYKNMMEWLEPGQVFVAPVNARSTVTLERLAQPATANYLLAKAPLNADGSAYYSVEARQRVANSYDVQLPGDAVIIHKVQNGYAYVVDADGNGDTGDAGAMWTVGEAFVDASNMVTITVEAATTTGWVVTIDLVEPVFTSCAAQAQIPTAECQALVDLYTQTNGSAWYMRTDWLEDGRPCVWYGVTCSMGRVRELRLNSNDLSGVLPASLGDLISLNTLELGNNQISGTLPTTLGGLGNLRYLNLVGNQLSGEIPASYSGLTGVQSLLLRNNHLSGAIPAWLNDLPGLTWLDLSSNRFSGGLPNLGSRVGMDGLLVHNNGLSGTIPISLTNLAYLTMLDLGYNQLEATDAGLLAFLADKDPDWAQTQTVTPENVQVHTINVDVQFLAGWTPILYTGNGGYYELEYASSAEGPFTWLGRTPDKAANTYFFAGPTLPLYVRVRSYTPAHGQQQNALWSAWSAPAQAYSTPYYHLFMTLVRRKY